MPVLEIKRVVAVGGLAVRELADGPITLAVIGAGTQARWQTRAIHAGTDIERIRVYSPSESREACGPRAFECCWR